MAETAGLLEGLHDHVLGDREGAKQPGDAREDSLNQAAKEALDAMTQAGAYNSMADAASR